MNSVAFELSSYTLKAFSGFSKARIRVKGEENIPKGSVIFCANHFTRIETIFLPYYIHALTHKKVWSLASKELFEVPLLEGLLNYFGAVSTGAPNRNDQILKTLIPGDAHWIIFPEGMMVKNKKLVKQNQFLLKDDTHDLLRPHTGAAVLGLTCAYFKQRLKRLDDRGGGPELDYLKARFGITDMDRAVTTSTHIVPVNITYYPARPRENVLSSVAGLLMKEPSERVMDELMTEGGFLFGGVDITIRFGPALDMRPHLNHFYIESMLAAKRRVRISRDPTARLIVRQAAQDIMEAYMGRVYAMTTVNYDHIMAGILKHLPYRPDGVEVYEFKCKLFYAVTELAKKRLCHLAGQFAYNQIHLLTDDRFKRISGFMDLAVQTGVIQIQESRLFKDHKRFTQVAHFHAVRLKNPILVMANEIEPLPRVEAFLKTVARKSFEDIRDAVRYKLKEKINSDFAQDYARFYDEEESKGKEVGRPLFLEQPSDKKEGEQTIGVLLIHGYMAAPMEMKQFAQFLHAQGFTVFVPRTRGHGTSPEDLARTTHEQWIESVEEGFAALDHTCSKTVIGGFSTGAGLALELATRVRDYAAAFAISPPMRLNDLGAFFVPAIHTWNSMIRKMNMSAMTKEFIVNSPENPHINYPRNPIAGVNQLEKLMDRLEPKLKTLKKPVLVALSRKDPVVSVKGAEKLFKLIGSERKEFYLFDYDRHGIINGKDVERVYQAVLNFIKGWVGQP